MTQSNGIKILTASQTIGYLKNIDVLKMLEQTFAALAKGLVVQPPQTFTLFPQNQGDFITYLGVIADQEVFGAKLSPYLPAASESVITPWTMLMSMKTGQPLMLCDSTQLTDERTAGVTALAVDKLAPTASKKLAVIGSGGLVGPHLKYVLPLREWESVTIYSPNLMQNGLKKANLLSLDGRITISESAAQCVAQADVVMLCTSSRTPVFSLDDIGQPALITSISTNMEKAHEISPECLAQMDVYCDYKQTTPLSAGEMVLASELHGWSAEQVVGDLADIAIGQCRLPDYQRSVFFRSIGLGIEDIAIANAVYQQAINE